MVAAGTSINKMKFAVKTIKDICSKKGVEVEVSGGNIYDVNVEKEDPDLIVIIGPNKFQTDVPVVSGMPFITKIGIEKTVNEIIKKLK